MLFYALKSLKAVNQAQELSFKVNFIDTICSLALRVLKLVQ
jgi:hypothetical protein